MELYKVSDLNEIQRQFLYDCFSELALVRQEVIPASSVTLWINDLLKRGCDVNNIAYRVRQVKAKKLFKVTLADLVDVDTTMIDSIRESEAISDYYSLRFTCSKCGYTFSARRKDVKFWRGDYIFCQYEGLNKCSHILTREQWQEFSNKINESLEEFIF